MKCKRGHNKEITGVSKDGHCVMCRRISRKKHYRYDPIKAKDSLLQYKFGITIDDYNKALVLQNFKCLGCNRHQDTFKRRLAVDHDHETGKVRALLCSGCNTALGSVKENIETLRRLEFYLLSSTLVKSLPV